MERTAGNGIPVVLPGAASPDEEVRRLHEDLSLSASKAKDSGRALLAIIRRLCSTFGWCFGEAWVPSRDGSVLKPGMSWPRTNPDFREYLLASRRLGFVPGGGLPGRAWSSLAPAWVGDIAAEEGTSFTRRRVAMRTGFRSALAIPLLSDDEAVAVFVLYRTEALAAEEASREAARTMAAIAPLGPVVARKQVEVELLIRERQQKAVARLGLHALAEGTDVEALMLDAVRLAASTLGVGHCKLLEFQPATGALLLRAGTGWQEGLVGRGEVAAGKGSQAGFTLLHGKPVIVQDIDKEERFTPSRLHRDHDIVCGLSVVIHGHQTPYGVLAVHGQQRRSFTNDDVHFLQAVANVVGTALERRRAERELETHRKQLETLVEQRTAQLEASHERLRIAERLASIGTLAAGLGHDLGNTILPILCRLDVMDGTPLSDAAREELAAVRHAVEYLRQLSQGLRLFALDPEDAGASTAATALPGWWATVQPLIRNALPARITLEADFPADLPPVAAPAHRLSQAVLNLAANAAEAIDGGGTVRISAAAHAEAGVVRLRVRDDGRGMTPDVRRHALDPFFTTKKRGLSTGLGLALVHGVAQGCGGSVDLDSAPGAGTTIQLSLPIAERASARGRKGGPGGEAPAPLVAAVSLGDPRLAAYATLLVRSAGLDARAATPEEPGDARVWIVEPSLPALAIARRYLDAEPGRRVVFVGDLPGAAREPGFVFVDRRGGPDALRRSLRQVVFQLLENDDEGNQRTDPRALRG